MPLRQWFCINKGLINAKTIAVPLTRMLHEGFGVRGKLVKKSSGKIFRASPEGVSLMDETNNQVGRSPADS